MKLRRGEAHVWLAGDAASGDELDAYESVLDEAERSRAARFHFLPDRRRFVIAHGLLRMILGVYDYVESATPAVSRRCALCGGRDHGKPYLALPGGEARLRFSISYCDGLIALAFSDGREIGVDVEAARRGSGWREVAGHVFSPGEKEALADVDSDAARRAFYTVWTRKEAASKVSGRGLTGVEEIDTCAWTFLDERAFEIPQPPPEAPWSGRDLELDDPHFGAVVVEGPLSELRCFTTDHREVQQGLREPASFGPPDLPPRERVRHGVG